MCALTDTHLHQIECIAKTLMSAQRKQMTVDMIVKTSLEASCKITLAYINCEIIYDSNISSFILSLNICM